MAKIPTAADLLQPIALSAAAKALLAPNALPRPYLDTLLDKKLYVDAARVMGQALPKPQVIWWAMQCVNHAYNENLPDPGATLFRRIGKWLKDPTDAERRAIHAEAEPAGFNDAASLTALAVFYTGPSISPEGLPIVPPAPHLAGDFSANAVILASLVQGSAKAAELYPAFFAIGLDVSTGKNIWKK